MTTLIRRHTVSNVLSAVHLCLYSDHITENIIRGGTCRFFRSSRKHIDRGKKIEYYLTIAHNSRATFINVKSVSDLYAMDNVEHNNDRRIDTDFRSNDLHISKYI